MAKTIKSAAELREALERIRLEKLAEELEATPSTAAIEEVQEDKEVEQIIARYVTLAAS